MGKGNSKLTQEDIDDMIKETEFTESELKVWHFPCLLLLPPPRLSAQVDSKYAPRLSFGNAKIFRDKTYFIYSSPYISNTLRRVVYQK